MDSKSKQIHISEEAFLIKQSGEIPEVTFHSSIYYLTADPEGPALKLEEEDIQPLKQAIVERYRIIINRDLDPGNRDKRIFRGMARCIVNWQRLLKFCTRENIDIEICRAETGEALKTFLQRELSDVQSSRRSASINCSGLDIENLACALGVALGDLPAGWRALCPEEG